MAKRLSKEQIKEIVLSFKDGKTIEVLSEKYNCTNLTIKRNLKKNLGEKIYFEFISKNKNKNSKDNSQVDENDINYDPELGPQLEFSGGHLKDTQTQDDNRGQNNMILNSEFVEISPLNFEIDNTPQKDLSSVPLDETDFPEIVYMVVSKNVELEIKLLKDFPEWEFLPRKDLNRKTIEVYFDFEKAKRECSKDQKVIKVPNTDVFKISSHILVSKGISRIVCPEKLIAL